VPCDCYCPTALFGRVGDLRFDQGAQALAVFLVECIEAFILDVLNDGVVPAALPPGVPPRVTGSRLLAVIGALSGVYHLSKRQTQGVLADLFDIDLSVGAISQGDALITDWKERANRLVAEFRADCGKYADQKPFSELIETLKRESSDFKHRWNSHHAMGRSGGSRQFSHPTMGNLRFEQATLTLSISAALRNVRETFSISHRHQPLH
jgi:transcription regulator MmyB-like protein